MVAVLALTTDGRMTKCSVPPEMRGIGRCNHVDHQEAGESVEKFTKRIEERMTITSMLPDQKEIVKKIIKENQVVWNKNPDWEKTLIEDAKGLFNIGTGENFESAEMTEVENLHTINADGDPVIKLTATFVFRGKEYKCDMGEIPEVQEDGTIIMNGVPFRVLPVMAKRKSGIQRTPNGRTYFVDEEGRMRFYADKNNPDVCIVNSNMATGRMEIPTEEVMKVLRGEPSKLSQAVQNNIRGIDPVAFEREPELMTNLNSIIVNHEVDPMNDITYRKCMTYQDQVNYEFKRQLRRMGNTFRANLKRKQDSGMELDDPNYPLFYQENITKNVKTDLAGRSNVQMADDLNAITALSQAHRISLTGPGGWNKDRCMDELRQIHVSMKDRIDVLDVSQGKNVGLAISLMGSDLDSRGFITKSTSNKEAVSDFMPYAKHNDTNRASMFSSHIRQACPIIGGEDPKFVGDSSDKAWASVSGSKLGTNARIAYISLDKNYEDAIVISRSMADKMTTVQNVRYDLKEQKRLRIGTKVHKGDMIGGSMITHDGIISKVNKNNFEVETAFKMEVGDKIAGRHGNKGVVAEIREDKDMPKMEVTRNGKKYMEPVEVVMPPSTVTGRLNLGQIYETNGGDFEKTTKVINSKGNKIECTAGTQFFMRLNQIADKKLHAAGYHIDNNGEVEGMRVGRMERELFTTTPKRMNILKYLEHQTSRKTYQRIEDTFKAVGGKITIRKVD